MAETTVDAYATAVRPDHVFDAAALARYLLANSAMRAAGFDGKLDVRQFSHGQSNPTFLLLGNGCKFVMRKKPGGKLLPGAHAIEREFEILQALHKHSDVPVPQPLALCEDPNVIGTPFYIMAAVEGRIFRDPLLPGVSVDERRALYEAMVGVLASLHRLDVDAIGLGGLAKRGHFVARQLKRWGDNYRLSLTPDTDGAGFAQLAAWLEAHVPADEPVALVHGDFRMDNMIFHPSEPRVLAVLDWELATLGHPLADVAYCAMPYVLGEGVGAFKGFGDADLAALGIPSEHAFVRRYAALRGLDSVPDLTFFYAFGMFRMTAILQGVYKRALAGNASSASAHSVGRLASVLAQLGLAVVRRGASRM